MKYSKIFPVFVLAGLLLIGPTLATAQTEAYLPTVQVGYPGIHPDTATLVPATLHVAFTGTDPDGPGGLPTHVRFLLVPADLDGQVINTRYLYESHADELVDFADEVWSPWIPFSPNPLERQITFPDLPDEEYFLMAFQAMDTAGAVSLERRYGREVFNFQVRANLFRPQVTLMEYYLGSTTNNSYSEIASGQPLNFSWIASAAAYNGQIVSYRHGFDLIDPNDPNDPGWSVPPGTAPQNLYAQERSFQEGYHTFTVRVVDDSGQVEVLTWDLNVIPFVSPDYQFPLLIIDQVVDSQTNQWPDAGGLPRDREEFRNAYWQFLEGAGGVSGFDWDQDRFDHTEQVHLSDLVWYKTTLIQARAHTQQLMFHEFRPQDGNDRYVWLAPYQERAGNIFLVGEKSMESFLEFLPNYSVPIIFDSHEEYYFINGQPYVAGFGWTELPDGSEVLRGTRMYPYAAAGISALDWAVPVNKYIYNRLNPGQFDRGSSCSGIKGLVLSPDFRSFHGVGPEALPDTIMTDATIDWRDGDTPGSANLDTAFPFYGDEFVDFNISARPTPILLQECSDGPDGLCVEPMFTSVARFDWLREGQWAAGNTGWPMNQYSQGELEEICGEMSQTSFDTGTEVIPLGTARTNGRTVGYLSYKNIEEKPYFRANVYWGFDPYRFDHESTRQAIRWVLEYFGLNINN